MPASKQQLGNAAAELLTAVVPYLTVNKPVLTPGD
jgi:hypothetical protein